ncbi:hypothetical protein [Aeromicrobium sp. P5_D10]
MTTSTVAPEILAFARGVRDALADLPADEVDDLTDGLEADLAESLAEDLRRTLPDPVAYAAELRLAAGLPVRETTTRSGVLASLVDVLRDARIGAVQALHSTPAAMAVVDFLAALRPGWWIFRAWLATWLSAAFFGMERGYWFEGAFWLVLLLFVIVSVQWGRGRLAFPGMRAVTVIGNLAAVVVLLPVFNAAQAWGGGTVYVETESAPDLTGVYLNGVPVTNIFGYDAKGRALTDIQLFDQDGKPLATSVPGGNGCLDRGCTRNGLWVPSALQNGTVVWNVFPMRMVEADYADDGGKLDAVQGAGPQDRPLPFERVPALVAPKKVAESD